MKRIALTDGSGRWFDKEKAEYYEEKRYHNGSNWISRATGSQWDHEAVYITKGGVFVLNSYTNYQGKPDSYEEITKDEAARWFARQEFADDELPPALKEDVYGFEIL